MGSPDQQSHLPLHLRTLDNLLELEGARGSGNEWLSPEVIADTQAGVGAHTLLAAAQRREAHESVRCVQQHIARADPVKEHAALSLVRKGLVAMPPVAWARRRKTVVEEPDVAPRGSTLRNSAFGKKLAGQAYQEARLMKSQDSLVSSQSTVRPSKILSSGVGMLDTSRRRPERSAAKSAAPNTLLPYYHLQQPASPKNTPQERRLSHTPALSPKSRSPAEKPRRPPPVRQPAPELKLPGAMVMRRTIGNDDHFNDRWEYEQYYADLRAMNSHPRTPATVPLRAMAEVSPGIAGAPFTHFGGACGTIPHGRPADRNTVGHVGYVHTEAPRGWLPEWRIRDAEEERQKRARERARHLGANPPPPPPRTGKWDTTQFHDAPKAVVTRCAPRKVASTTTATWLSDDLPLSELRRRFKAIKADVSGAGRGLESPSVAPQGALLCDIVETPSALRARCQQRGALGEKKADSKDSAYSSMRSGVDGKPGASPECVAPCAAIGSVRVATPVSGRSGVVVRLSGQSLVCCLALVLCLSILSFRTYMMLLFLVLVVVLGTNAAQYTTR